MNYGVSKQIQMSKTPRAWKIFLVVGYLLLVIGYWLLAANSFAVAPPTFLDTVRETIGEPPLTKLSDTENVILDIAEWFIALFWILAVAFVVWAAFLYLSAGGNEEKISEAKKRLLYALIATAIALLATGIDYIVTYLLTGSSYYY